MEQDMADALYEYEGDMWDDVAHGCEHCPVCWADWERCGGHDEPEE